MFERHFGLRENPFHSGHQMRFLYPSREHQEARAHLRYGIENREPFVLITGEVGTGKTTALYDALAEWGTQVTVALITNSALTRQELLEEIGMRFGLALPPGASKPQALAHLERHLLAVRGRGEHAVLLLDEAQNLVADLLEEIRLLSNLEAQGEKLLQIFLVGQPELEAKLARPELRQLRQRITVHYRLNPLSPEETAGYIHHRISVAGGNAWAAFPPDACREVYRVTHGIPREINTVASQALLAAFTEGSATVRPDHVRAVAVESEFRSVLGAPVEGGEAAQAGDGAREAAQARAGAPEAPAPGAPTPPEETPPAWSPPDLENAPRNETVEPVAREELDAWTAAAKDLIEAKRKSGVAAAAREAAGGASAGGAPFGAERAGAREAAGGIERIAAGEREESMAAPARRATPSPYAQAIAASPAPEVPRFPTPAELHARAAEARPDAADLSGLPEELRKRIQDDIERDENRPDRRAPLVLGLIALVAIATLLVVMQRSRMIDVPFLRAFGGGSVADAAAKRLPEGAAPGETAASDSGASGQAAASEHEANGKGAALDAGAGTVAGAVVAKGPGAAPSGRDTSRQAALRALPDPNRAIAAPPGARQVASEAPSPTTAPPVAPNTSSDSASSRPVAASVAAKPPDAPAMAKPMAAPPTARPSNTASRSAATKPKPAGSSAARASASTYGVGVAEYLDADRANVERDRLASLSHLPATVVSYQDAGTTMYRVVLGRYPSSGAADKAATDIMSRLGVGEARPVLLAKAAK